jgi:alpha-ketoglutarate-dependent taurine dioxygenase
MNEHVAPEFGGLRNVRRKAVSVSTESLVKTSQLDGAELLPLVIEPGLDHVNLVGWAALNREWIETQLLKHGGILFRGFEVAGVEQFEEVARTISPQLLDYRERSSPRSEVSKGIYTSTDHPADQYIHFHNEQSYTHSWPMKLWFFCVRPAEKGGATLIADGRKVLSLLNPEIRERFVQKKVKYVRNYGDNFGLSWQVAFQTEKRAEVEEYCRKASIGFEWKDEDHLRTSQVFDPIVKHPRTGESVWFEHTAFFHVSSIEPELRDALLKEFEEEDLPFNTYYADGSRIEDAVLDDIREAYRQTTVRFDWREKEILLIDNMLTSHGREPFAGPRKIVVAMAELFPPSNF